MNRTGYRYQREMGWPGVVLAAACLGLGGCGSKDVKSPGTGPGEPNPDPGATGGAAAIVGGAGGVDTGGTGGAPMAGTGGVPMTGSGGAPMMGTGGTPDTMPPVPVATEDQGCPDIFTQDRMRTYEVEIDPEQWRLLEAEFRAGPPLNSMNEEKTYYPLKSVRYGDEVRTDAAIRLRGNSSWAFTIMEDANPKAQFLIAFDKRGTEVPFHGVNRIAFDMPRLDRTMLHERLAYAYMRLGGLPAPCANSAQLMINGQLYGVYVSKEHYGGKLLKRLFPGASEGVLLGSGLYVEENLDAYNPIRLMQFWMARDMATMLPLIDVEHAMKVWAAEAMLNDADGYWGGDHNFFTYDHPQRGFLWLSDDPDATFEWLGMHQHPVYWWAGRGWVPPAVPQHYLAVITDATWRGRFVGALADRLAVWDVGKMQGWIDAWSAQIADAVARDPHLPFPVADHRAAVVSARAVVADRAAYVRSFLACEQGIGGGAAGGGAEDRDKDGAPWCRDCDDARPDTYPGAPEICGDRIDQDCDSVKDDGCPPL